jgi:hypothetical protein
MRPIQVTPTLLLQKSISVINIIGILLALSLLTGTLGMVDSSVLHLASLFLLLGITLLNIPLRRTFHLLRTSATRYPSFLGSIILLIAFLVLLLSTTPILWIASIPLLLVGLSILTYVNTREQHELPLLVTASFGYTLLYILIQTIPSLWYVLQQTSLVVSHTVGVIIGTPLLLGPTTSGLWILLLSIIFLCCSALLIPKKSRKDLLWFITCIVTLVLLWVLYLVVLSIITPSSNADAIRFHPVFFSLNLIVLLIYYLRYPFASPTPPTTLFKTKRTMVWKTGAIWVALLLFLSVSILTISLPLESQNDSKKVLFYGEHMLGTWDVPQYGKYGREGVGMFGLWPIYLSTLGYEPELLVENTIVFLNETQPINQNITSYLNLTDYVSVIESPHLTTSLLNDIRILVITNLNVSFTPAEHTAIWEYVNTGGSLLVIGDHTNVGGMQHPLNELLSPVGISFRFDAALPLDDTNKWITCARLLQHPLTLPITGIDELQYGVGASLNISTGTSPLVIGTYALSDQGNRSSADLAYLGDYAYNKGEQLGDVILVAAAYYGHGKVVVFGDTSSFQNTALPFSYPLLQSTFSWLAGSHNSTTTTLQLGIGLILLIGAAILFYFSKKNSTSSLFYPAILMVALLLTSSLNPVFFSHPSEKGPLVTIDVSHLERVAQESFTDDSLNGLIVNLQRNNYLPILLRDFSSSTISTGKILICVAPTASFTGDQLTFLKQYMTQGGYIILATGYDDKDASLPLLQLFNISIESTPLGPVPYIEGNTTLFENEPRFVDSWPLSFPQNQGTSYYNFTWDDHTYYLVVFAHYGNGGLLVISDSQFLLDKNIESIYDYWPGNIIFLKHLIDELKTMEEH